MKYKKLLIAMALTLSTIPLLYNACGNVNFTGGGVNISVMGNPLTPTESSKQVLFAICSVLSHCQEQVSMDACMSGVAATSGLAATLGLPATYGPYSSVESAEASGTITGNLNSTNACVAAIDTLTCGSSAVSGAYNSGLAKPFAGVANMIPAQACGGVFSNSPQTYEYIYLGDSNSASLSGYSINLTSGVLTAIPNTPTVVSGNSLSLGKIAGTTQVVAAVGGAFRITPATGVLSAVTGSGILANNSGQQAAMFSPTGLNIFALANTKKNAWVAAVDPATGNFLDAVETADFSAPITNAFDIVMSPAGNYAYFIDPTGYAIQGFTASAGLTAITGTSTGTGVNVGDQTYGLTLLPSPNAGNYDMNFPAYVDVGASVLYLFFAGATTADNNWIMPYKINADGSLTAGTPFNMGTNAPNGDVAARAGDSTGRYLFLSLPTGSKGSSGITTYSIGVNGSLTYSSGPVFLGKSFWNLAINSASTVLYGNGKNLATASINLTTGVLTPVSSVTDPCGDAGPLTLDPSETFLYVVDGTRTPANVICGFTVNSAGIVGSVSGQSYPLAIPASNQIRKSVTTAF